MYTLSIFFLLLVVHVVLDDLTQIIKGLFQIKFVKPTQK